MVDQFKGVFYQVYLEKHTLDRKTIYFSIPNSILVYSPAFQSGTFGLA